MSLVLDEQILSRVVLDSLSSRRVDEFMLYCFKEVKCKQDFTAEI